MSNYTSVLLFGFLIVFVIAVGFIPDRCD